MLLYTILSPFGNDSFFNIPLSTDTLSCSVIRRPIEIVSFSFHLESMSYYGYSTGIMSSTQYDGTDLPLTKSSYAALISIFVG